MDSVGNLHPVGMQVSVDSLFPYLVESSHHSVVADHIPDIEWTVRLWDSWYWPKQLGNLWSGILLLLHTRLCQWPVFGSGKRLTDKYLLVQGMIGILVLLDSR